ncbi:DNA-binding FrmR family transcriptional regulator [Bradyrhizobium diazoefficiens]
MNELPAVPSQRRRAISPRAVTIDLDGHPAGFVRHIDLSNVVAPDFPMGNAVSSNENLVQATGRGAKSRPIGATKLIEMERNKLVSPPVFQIADESASDADAVFPTDLLGLENFRTDDRRQLLQAPSFQVRPSASRRDRAKCVGVDRNSNESDRREKDLSSHGADLQQAKSPKPPAPRYELFRHHITETAGYGYLCAMWNAHGERYGMELDRSDSRVARKPMATLSATIPPLRYPPQGDMFRLMAHDHVHETHPNIVKRLKRAEGHLHKVIEMFGDGRPCLDLAQQLHAVEKAINEAKKTLIHDHVDHCLDTAANGGRSKSTGHVIAEFKAISRYL